MEISPAEPGTRTLTQDEVRELLAQPHLMRLGFLDAQGWPVVHAVWVLFEDDRLWTTVGADSLKARSFARDDRTYFTIDTDAGRGVRGKARARVHRDQARAEDVTRKSLRKYTGSEEGRIAEALLADVRNGETVLVELQPVKLLSWAY